MEMEILGSGEAYDSLRVNASVLLDEAHFRLLIDCGPGVPQALWRRQLAPDEIDAIFFTHCHPDHALGLTSLLNWQESLGRRAPLHIIAPRRQLEVLRQLAHYAFWPAGKPCFTIGWQASERLTRLGPWQCRLAPTRHSLPNSSLLLSGSAGSLLYSGDGRLSPAGAALLLQADMALIECFSVDDDAPYHGCWSSIRDLARKPGAPLGLYHIQQQQRSRLQQAIADSAGVFLPEQGDRWRLSQQRWLACPPRPAGSAA
ncbi:ribonuclease Z [Affinibrenneria salicis]|uniref:Ribonuclease Z n=1 Tax=Affinibrenneria salicis TaxID=2590031 RepID=A0A5J5FS98_9GAMM|nr:MBL fold metallo-hydrolase [Affinibrenneria salicis]KAA8996161.1 ribonuclease Z [Affinibrenneria salicis]